jgi:hypothetical protein
MEGFVECRFGIHTATTQDGDFSSNMILQLEEILVGNGSFEANESEPGVDGTVDVEAIARRVHGLPGVLVSWR